MMYYLLFLKLRNYIDMYCGLSCCFSPLPSIKLPKIESFRYMHFNTMYIHHDSREQTCMCCNISFFDLYIHFACTTLFIRYYAGDFLN